MIVPITLLFHIEIFFFSKDLHFLRLARLLSSTAAAIIMLRERKLLEAWIGLQIFQNLKEDTTSQQTMPDYNLRRRFASSSQSKTACLPACRTPIGGRTS